MSNVEPIGGLPLTTEKVNPVAIFDPLPEAENLFRKRCANIIEKEKIPFSNRLPMKSGCRSVIFSLMPPISTQPACMSLSTGVGVSLSREMKREVWQYGL